MLKNRDIRQGRIRVGDFSGRKPGRSDKCSKKSHAFDKMDLDLETTEHLSDVDSAILHNIIGPVSRSYQVIGVIWFLFYFFDFLEVNDVFSIGLRLVCDSLTHAHSSLRSCTPVIAYKPLYRAVCSKLLSLNGAYSRAIW